MRLLHLIFLVQSCCAASRFSQSDNLSQHQSLHARDDGNGGQQPIQVDQSTTADPVPEPSQTPADAVLNDDCTGAKVKCASDLECICKTDNSYCQCRHPGDNSGLVDIVSSATEDITIPSEPTSTSAEVAPTTTDVAPQADAGSTAPLDAGTNTVTAEIAQQTDSAQATPTEIAADTQTTESVQQTDSLSMTATDPAIAITQPAETPLIDQSIAAATAIDTASAEVVSSAPQTDTAQVTPTDSSTASDVPLTDQSQDNTAVTSFGAQATDSAQTSTTENQIASPTSELIDPSSTAAPELPADRYRLADLSNPRGNQLPMAVADGSADRTRLLDQDLSSTSQQGESTQTSMPQSQTSASDAPQVEPTVLGSQTESDQSTAPAETTGSGSGQSGSTDSAVSSASSSSLSATLSQTQLPAQRTDSIQAVDTSVTSQTSSSDAGSPTDLGLDMGAKFRIALPSGTSLTPLADKTRFLEQDPSSTSQQGGSTLVAASSQISEQLSITINQSSDTAQPSASGSTIAQVSSSSVQSVDITQASALAGQGSIGEPSQTALSGTQTSQTSLSATQTSGAVGLWGDCTGGKSCADGSQCVCKSDNSFCQCRTQTDGSWGPKGESGWGGVSISAAAGVASSGASPGITASPSLGALTSGGDKTGTLGAQTSLSGVDLPNDRFRMAVQSTTSSGAQSTNVASLWGDCTGGKASCPSGSQCICKDNSFCQCRAQVDGAWAPKDAGWACSTPGCSGAAVGGSSNPTATQSGQGSGASTTAAANAVALWGMCTGGLSCASGSQCICKDSSFCQCRTQVDGSWAPKDAGWACSTPGCSGAAVGGTNNPTATGSQGSSLNAQQTGTPVALWGACTGGRTCTSGSQCICKDSSFCQCRTQVDGSWAPKDAGWACSTPGCSGAAVGTATGTATGTQGAASTASGVAMWGTCTGNLPCASGGQCICKDSSYCQCRSQVDGSWAPKDGSWKCTQPGCVPPGGMGQAGNSTQQAGQLRSGGFSIAQNTTAPGIYDNAYTNRTVQKGDCTNTPSTQGFQGASSTSAYGHMGSACQCGSNKGDYKDNKGTEWQADASNKLGLAKGWYGAAVTNNIFRGATPQGSPNCGGACGSCFELQTTGSNVYYNSGSPASAPGGGSNIRVIIVDACYNQNGGDNWCQSTSQDGSAKDNHGCNVHWDIQTSNLNSDTHGSAPVPQGADGNNWALSGDIVQYRTISCDSSLANRYSADCNTCGGH